MDAVATKTKTTAILKTEPDRTLAVLSSFFALYKVPYKE